MAIHRDVTKELYPWHPSCSGAFLSCPIRNFRRLGEGGLGLGDGNNSFILYVPPSGPGPSSAQSLLLTVSH